MGNKSSSSSSSNDDAPPSPPLPPAEEHDSSRRPSYYTMAKQGYSDLVNAIIRPPRADYELDALGPTFFKFCGAAFTRTVSASTVAHHLPPLFTHLCDPRSPLNYTPEPCSPPTNLRSRSPRSRPPLIYWLAPSFTHM